VPAAPHALLRNVAALLKFKRSPNADLHEVTIRAGGVGPFDPDLLDAIESTWEFVGVDRAVCDRKWQASTLQLW
jgi:hypothetical protein